MALSRVRRPTALQEWRSLGGPSGDLRNPSLLFVHGDLDAHRLVLPPSVNLYWPLQGAGLTESATMALPNTGLLFAVDAVPLNATGHVHGRYPRPDLWRAERGRVVSGAWAGERERRSRRNGQRRWK